MRAAAVLVLAACAAPPEGLRATPDGTGPLVRVDWEALPLPDVPFPTDLATRPVPSSPTGLRLNLPVDAPVALERHSRELLNEQPGFGLFSPITVGFDARIDLDDVLRRHRDDLHDPAAWRDDAFYLIDVDPDSPERGRPVQLEVGHGRFPQIAAQLGKFLPNDPRADNPSLLFETANEDANGNGVLDPGEDTDGDGLLDVPNVWPPGGDARSDLLTWYDLQSDTLFLRPVLPLREGTTYALVLTEDLAGVGGQPVRSPWAWVNHTRQTDALQPVIGALEALGRGVDDIAFTWTFTTGTPTTDLWELAEGLRGRGPYRDLARRFPPGVDEAHELHTNPALGDPLFLPSSELIDPLNQIGLLPDASFDIMADMYQSFTAGVVGGTYLSPDLLYDRDDEGRDDSDEHFVIDRANGWVDAVQRRVAFTCAIPTASGDIQPPWPVAIHAHGYGSTRAELVAFAYALNRVGIAVCSIDAPGQGLTLTDDEELLVGAVLEISDTQELWWHILDSRVRDLDNDGIVDAAGDVFSADAFHTRDVLRQPVLDWVQLIRTLQACGTGEMERTLPGADGPVRLGEHVQSCDWDGDGAPDLGGPDTRFVLHGVSQGGIMTSMSIAVQEADTAVVTVPGGGLGDVAGRTEITEVSDGMVGRALSPLILGRPQSDGTLEITQMVVSVDTAVEVHVATLPDTYAGGHVVVRNLDLDEEESGPIPADGALRVPIAANALDAAQKALATGIPARGAGLLEVYELPDNDGLGDRLQIEVFDASGREVAVIDRFEREVVHEGVTMQADSPLVAASFGLGLRRGSTDLRRLVGVLGMAVEPGDPIAYARRWHDEPFADPKKVLVHLTAGDTIVPISSGLALARAAGLVDHVKIDERWGTTADRFLIDNGVVHGLEEDFPFTDAAGSSVLFDADDLDRGTDASGAPSTSPLRAGFATADGTTALRILYVEPRGTHAYFAPDESLAFDWALFSAQQMAWYLATGGEVSDDPCLATRDCPFLRPILDFTP